MRLSLSSVGALLAAVLASAACAPLTYSEDGAVDFETYAAVRVSVTSTTFAGDGSEYLAGELEKSSGFSHVTTDAAASVDAVLGVTVEVVLSSTVDGNGQLVEQYDGTAHYTLGANGSSVDSGEATSSEADSTSAVRAALDGVATHYIAPYRL